MALQRTLIHAHAAGNGDASETYVPLEVEPYVRPADWLTLPTLTEGEQRFVGLHAVYEHQSNFLAVRFAGAYTINWGDGVVENYASSAIAYHNYDYNAASLVGTESTRGYRQAVVSVTPQGTGNLTTVDLHIKHNMVGLQMYASGWLDVKVVGALVTNLTIGTNSPTITFRNLEQFEYVGPCADTALSYVFYDCTALRKVIGTQWTAVSTTMLSMFQNCYSIQEVPAFNLNAMTTAQNMFVGCWSLLSVPPLSVPAATSLVGMFATCTSLQKAPEISNTNNVTTVSSIFNGCSNLREVPVYNTSNVTNFGSAFSSCRSMNVYPEWNTSKGTDFSSMFGSCVALKLRKLPTYDTSQGTNFNYMFKDCTLIENAPPLDTSKGTTFTGMFQNCVSLKNVPAYNMGLGTNFSLMFASCTSLRTAPAFITTSGTVFDNMFTGCTSLMNVALFDTSKATTVGYMFNGCTRLETIPAFNTGNATTFSNMFAGCTNLKRIPTLDTSKGTSFGAMFSGCNSLQEIPALNLTAATASSGLTSMMNSMASLGSILAFGAKYSITISNNKMSGAALNTFYTNLGTAAGTQTVTVSNNWGRLTDDPTIATAKGWTVTGS